MDRCDECGFVYADHSGAGLTDELRSTGRQIASILGGEQPKTAMLTHRPDPQTWSALEYSCHVRDVLLAQRERLFLALVEDTPTFAPIHRDERVVMDGYNTQDPEAVGVQITLATELLINVLSRLDEVAWQRDCLYNFPTPTRRTLAWFAAHTLHEVVHHLGDIERVLASAP